MNTHNPRPHFELADILTAHLAEFEGAHYPPAHHRRVLKAITQCRTAALGGHVDQCNSCSHVRISYNSCRNRHCPRCQGVSRQRWIDARVRDLLPVTYFHVVFTIPHELHPLCVHHPVLLYNTLFDASRQTIETFAADPKHLGARPGMISLLHTWGQNLSLHPHVHMIVPGGGMSDAGYWKQVKSKGAFLFPVKAMSIVFKNKFLDLLRSGLVKMKKPLDEGLRKTLYNKQWIVYAKLPFGGPAQVIEYLGRYSHKVAISSHRIKDFRDGIVTFTYKDYADGGGQKTMKLPASEFIRRFCLHILPAGFRKIRHAGILASRCKPRLREQQASMGVMAQLPKQQTWKEVAKQKLNFDADACPCCKTGSMIRIMTFNANAPPLHLLTPQSK